MLYFAVVQIICRLAVPFFAVCTGYYLGGKLSFADRLEKSDKNRKIFLHQWKKIFVLYFIWSCLYLVFSIPFWIEIGWFSPMAFVDYAVAALTSGSHYHLWYLVDLLYTLPLVYLLLRFIPTKHHRLLILICWAFAIFNYTYKSFFPADVLPSFELLNYFQVFNVLTPLILLGVQISREKSMRGGYLAGFAVSFVCLSAEAFTLRNFGVEKVSYIVFTLPTAYFLFCMVLKCGLRENTEKSCCAAMLGTISTIVYCVHPMFIETVGKKIDSSVWTYLIVALMSTAVGYICCMMKRKIKEKKEDSCFN